MGTSLIASLATHRSISHYVASLLAPKSHSSCHEQNASLIARSSSFAYPNNGFHSSAQWPRSSGLRPCSGAGNPHPLRSMVSLGAGIPAPLARYHTIVICKGNHIKPPTTRSPTQKYQSIVTQKSNKNTTYWKMFRYPHVLYYYLTVIQYIFSIHESLYLKTNKMSIKMP